MSKLSKNKKYVELENVRIMYRKNSDTIHIVSTDEDIDTSAFHLEISKNTAAENALRELLISHDIIKEDVTEVPKFVTQKDNLKPENAIIGKDFEAYVSRNKTIQQEASNVQTSTPEITSPVPHYNNLESLTANYDPEAPEFYLSDYSVTQFRDEIKEMDKGNTIAIPLGKRESGNDFFWTLNMSDSLFPKASFDHVLVTGGIGSGKTMLAQTVMSYALKNPLSLKVVYCSNDHNPMRINGIIDRKDSIERNLIRLVDELRIQIRLFDRAGKDRKKVVYILENPKFTPENIANINFIVDNGSNYGYHLMILTSEKNPPVHIDFKINLTSENERLRGRARASNDKAFSNAFSSVFQAYHTSRKTLEKVSQEYVSIDKQYGSTGLLLGDAALTQEQRSDNHARVLVQGWDFVKAKGPLLITGDNSRSLSQYVNSLSTQLTINKENKKTFVKQIYSSLVPEDFLGASKKYSEEYYVGIIAYMKDLMSTMRKEKVDTYLKLKDRPSISILFIDGLDEFIGSYDEHDRAHKQILTAIRIIMEHGHRFGIQIVAHSSSLFEMSDNFMTSTKPLIEVNELSKATFVTLPSRFNRVAYSLTDDQTAELEDGQAYVIKREERQGRFYVTGKIVVK